MPRKRSMDVEEALAKAQKALRDVYGPMVEENPVMRDYDPFVSLVVAANDPSLPSSTAAKMHAEALQYVYPKLKATEVSGEGFSSGSIQVVLWGKDNEPHQVSAAEQKRVIEGKVVEAIPQIEPQEVPSRDDDG